MSSSPSSIKQRTPKRTSPKRAPLQERTASHANEISSRLGKKSRSREGLNIYSTNLFPTKPSQVLLPSTLRKQKSFGPSPLSDTPGFLSDSDAGASSVSWSSRGSQPTVRLKRSVKALRDLYEAQADDSSRPSTATSPPLRASTANSVRLRSLSSSESLSAAYAWESLRQTSNDDLSLLPSLPAGGCPVKMPSSRTSFTSVAENATLQSSPNYYTLVTVSPRPAAPKVLHSPLLEAFEDQPSSSSARDSSSSPNIVRLGRTSSSEQFPSTNESSGPNVVRLTHTSSTQQFGSSDPLSSPNVIKLRTTSPEHSPATARPPTLDHSRRSRSSSTSSRKRRRSDSAGGRSFAARIGGRPPLASSPPTNRYISSSAAASTSSVVDAGLPSSAPHSIQQSSAIDESSPVILVSGRDEPTSDGSYVTETHSSLQAALNSSPPRIHYPVVRAPPPSQHVGISVPKRNSRSMSTEADAPRFSSTLSAVPSEDSWSRPRPISQISELSSVPDDLDDYLKSDELAPASSYIIHEGANETQIPVAPDYRPETATKSQCECESECDHQSIYSHHYEATDEVSALPFSEYAYRSQPQRQAHSGAHLDGSSSGATSVHQSTARLNSLKSFTQSRQNSSLRPSSSSSSILSIAPVPSWARRYYSGTYADTFQYLYSSGSYLSLKSLAVKQTPIPVSTLALTPSRPDTSRSNVNPSLRDAHQSISERAGALLRPKRPKTEVKKSHILPCTRPLVSSPLATIRSPPATAKHPFAHGARRQSYQHPQTQSMPTNQHSRAVSMPLPPVDPRAHWAGVVEIHEVPHEDGRDSSYTIRHDSYTYSTSGSESESRSQSVLYHPGAKEMRRSWHRRSSSPHLHHDARLNTGSSLSRGFGFPFNSKSRWTTGVPELTTTDGDRRDSALHLNLRSVQVFAFAAGFVMPLTWFVGAFLPLPKRPDTFGDIEKQVFRESHQQRRQSPGQRNSRPSQDVDWGSGSLDMLAKLRLERHHAGVAELKYQNARWWRNLNRWMCTVGLVVIVLAVVLAILGTKHNWGGS